ncbi:Nodule Cysteine-Rich (NCR) secreted peptide [Medicago truncatula]|uniref:Nodule Cysteine-Rich (NCR) secreted peptide n=1 Tax=Medicago truncatula TaxID=3880 RepID=A0A072VLD0_MEDTR|nr:Nodule Cysteine-Rich (NCR) secreted peptide [Medicago truncatula]
MAEILKIVYFFIILLSLILVVTSQYSSCATKEECKCPDNKRPACLWKQCYCY